MASTHELDYVDEQQFNRVIYAMLALATIFTIARACVQALRRTAMESQDYLLYTGYILFLALSVSTLLVSSKIFMIYRVRSHLISPPKTMKEDIIWGVRMVNACNVLFLLSLWMVKLSFIASRFVLILELNSTNIIMIVAMWWWNRWFWRLRRCRSTVANGHLPRRREPFSSMGRRIHRIRWGRSIRPYE